MDIEFERDSLFAEVWSVPISTLCKKYGISDNGLRKVCIALSIPLPGRGHWAKLAAGHTVETPQLPPTSGRTKFISQKSALSEGASCATEQTALQAHLSFEDDPQNTVVVTAELTKPHPLIVATRQAVQSRRNELIRSRDHKRRPQKPGEPWRPELTTWAWKDYERRGHIGLATDVLPMRVSLDAADRALRIWNAIIRACEARALTVCIDQRVLKVSDGANHVGLRMSEKLERVTRQASSGRYEELNRPTGCIRFFVVGDYESKFEDKRDLPVEMQLNDVLKRLYRSLEARRLWREKIDRVIREQAEAEKLREEALAAEAEAARIIEEEARAQQLLRERELERERALVTEAAAWRDAVAIRAYAAHIRTAEANCSSIVPTLHEWLTWADGVADKLDPTLRRLTAIVTAPPESVP